MINIHNMIRATIIMIALIALTRSVLASDIVLEETDLRRFIGRIDADPAALNGQSVWLDSLIAESPETSLNRDPIISTCMPVASLRSTAPHRSAG